MFITGSRAQFWRSHAKPALLLFIGPALLCATTQLDPTLAGALFFDYSGAGWIGADRWFVNELIHTGGRCFPAAHASSGYAFMALYFLGYERSRKLARFGLAAGLLLGLIFGVAQQSRGAHFISHDLWSALFAWMIPLTLYAFTFDRRLYAQPEPCASRCSQPPQRSSFDLLPLLPPKCRALWSELPSETCSTTCGRGD